MEIKKLKDLTPDSRNANRGSERGQSMIENSLRQYGAGRSILIDKNGVIIAGNKTAENAGAIGLDDVIVVQTDGTKLVAVQRMDLDLTKDKAAKALAVVDNRSSEVSLDWSVDALKELGEEIDLEQFWSKDELAALLADAEILPAELIGDEDSVPDAPADPITKPGDIYRLGNHRLMCGDSTSITDVDLLLAGEKADMVFTDPPYGIEVVRTKSDGKKHNGDGGTFGGKKNEKAGAKRIDAKEYAPIIGDDTTDTAVDAYNLCAGLGIPVLIFWGGNHYADRLPASKCWIVWDKDTGTNDFADAELAWTNRATPVRVFKHQWNGLVKASERGESRVHPTQKPVALAEWAFEQYGSQKDKVLDLFGGSGSTLIACEKTGRACYMMEMAPAYCDVIVARWEAATGKKAVLAEGAVDR
jgi:16S rRNA G966 N2-methylase RsmD